jgi:hypothetical protein
MVAGLGDHYMRILGIVVLCAAAALAGCTRTVNVTSTFNPAEAEFINRKGQGQINGQLFMRQAGGNVVYGAGSVVSLFPQTTYTSERMQKVFQGSKLFPSVLGLQIENEDPNFASFKRDAKADGQGRFTFPDLAPGNYYVTGVVTRSLKL